MPSRSAVLRDTSIRTYRAKRDFSRTSEPLPRKAKPSATATLKFVVQKHAARRLHWDFRLEHEGVLLSWAVPKGPSLDPSDKRLAVRVEDHPLDYAAFQGSIPQGHYGAGTVEIWDQGEWTPEGDPAEAIEQGELKFRLAGTRLKGGFVLVRLRQRGRERAENWLLIKEHDAEERRGIDAEALEASPGPEGPVPARGKAKAEEGGRDVPSPEAERQVSRPRRPVKAASVRAPALKRGSLRIGGVQFTHAERELWPGITKRDLADYWQTVAAYALPGIATRPLALLRCPEGIEGERFFQKHGNKGMPPSIREGAAEEGPYLAIDDEEGLVACAQMSAIELHVWGSPESDTAHPDHIVFDLDPGEGVVFGKVVEAAKEIRARLKKAGLESFCRTTGGKGLHVVAPIRRAAGWDAVRTFCHRFAATMEAEMPDRFVSTVPKAKRRGRILVDWLRNGPGATAVASYSPRARPGATVATPLSWREVTAKLDPQAFTLATVPARLKRLKKDPWEGFSTLDQTILEGPH
ncbi:MAG TPA: non-homologous end-joining DNA ligase [Roseomonas sp.]|nr:non-homologous end-joining DNA ligase [Roseomonas sp.]